MLKFKNKKYDFELCNTVRTAPALARNINSDIIKLMDDKKFMGFFYSFLLPVFEAGLFGTANLGHPNQTEFKSQIPFNSILSFQGKNLDDLKLCWKRYCSGLAKPSQNGRAVVQVYR